jgi:hypothetical protein
MTGSHPAPGPADSDAALSSALDEMAAVTDRLLESVDRMSPEAVQGPSLMPGWTRGHVLTHVARNADAITNLVLAARTGDGRPMYARWPGGPGGRHPGRGRPPPRRPAAGPGRVGRAAAGRVRRRLPRGGQVAGGRDAARRHGVRLGDPADPGPGGRDPPRRPGLPGTRRSTGTPPSPPAPWTSWRRSSAAPATVRSGCWWPPTWTPGGRSPRRVRSSPARSPGWPRGWWAAPRERAWRFIPPAPCHRSAVGL